MSTGAPYQPYIPTTKLRLPLDMTESRPRRRGKAGACSSYIVARRVFRRRRLDRVGNKAQDGTEPQQQRETSEQQLAELDPLRDGLRRTELIESVSVENLTSALYRQALQRQPTPTTVFTSRFFFMLVSFLVSFLLMFTHINLYTCTYVHALIFTAPSNALTLVID